ncbi:pyruvate dehydrogenase (acetyl-transferring), homodimeric type [uncultured Paludibaculum sp.]|uniref:pyruvate dehydrogenase (acetyl-transferring), homodimeric type n=1 Tax=uncultured Paludibaculum sp. TaxID=1765020 RepID=UPI002AAC1948|nr:pyruvate dehydrogenase (acetyl-transferring), homodimeric type [uncultured Paludibaculum sp.]
MLRNKVEKPEDLNPVETQEWLEALDQVIEEGGPERARYLLERLAVTAATQGVPAALGVTTPYLNTIAVDDEVPYPGDRELERRIKSIVRWNAVAMVVRANKYDDGIGGHISTFASSATLYEVGMNHFFRGSIPTESGDQPGDLIYFQGHASPGMYSRAFLEGRLTEEHLKNFRHELRETPGLSSYPHPWLMPDFWQFPTVSMGLGPINAIYQARFCKYLENRGLMPKTNRKIWAFLGDGEMDEPESRGALQIAANEKLDNLVFVINCNLQRLDGPVRGNGNIMQELEGVFRGFQWNVIKLVWGSDWDRLLEKDKTGLLIRRMHECVDGEFQSFKARGGAYVRSEFFGKYPELLDLVSDMSDDEIFALRRGGHDPVKVYNAYKRAFEHTGGPTVILAKTVKGYGMGEAGEGRNTTHQQKKMNENELLKLRERFKVPIPEETVHTVSFYRPSEDSPEMKYLKERRKVLGGPLPIRQPKPLNLDTPAMTEFSDSLGGSGGRPVSTTMAFVAILKQLLKDKALGKLIIPIIPDEARTFGMESLFRQISIYAPSGQLYKPVDSEQFLYYKEAVDGQVLEEGINEAGSLASFTAAGTAYANYGIPTIPFYIYYSMFGFQRVGDAIWAFGDSRGRGFLLGATAGRTTLNGEGLQHEDGHSHVLASTVPNCVSYDPAYAYEIATIIQDGLRRMYHENEDVFYYLTLCNENYAQPAMPEGAQEGILKGIYKVCPSEHGAAKAQLWGSASMLNEALRAQKILWDKFQIPADVWSVTSYNELRREALDAERWNRLHPAEPARKPYIQQVMEGTQGPIVAASDYMKVVSDQLSPWLSGRLTALGTDGFGRSESRPYLRRFFEVDAESIATAAISQLARWGQFDAHKAQQAIFELGIDPEKKSAARN